VGREDFSEQDSQCTKNEQFRFCGDFQLFDNQFGKKMVVVLYRTVKMFA